MYMYVFLIAYSKVSRVNVASTCTCVDSISTDTPSHAAWYDLYTVGRGLGIIFINDENKTMLM